MNYPILHFPSRALNALLLLRYKLLSIRSAAIDKPVIDDPIAYENALYELSSL